MMAMDRSRLLANFGGAARKLLINSRQSFGLRPERLFASSQLGVLRSGSSPKRCSLASASLRPNCPVCGPTEGAGTPWSQAGPWWDSGVSRHQPAVPLYNKQRQFGEAVE